MRSILSSVFLFGVAMAAYAIDATDEGVYVLLSPDQGHETKKMYRLGFKENGWTLESSQPDGTWSNVLCDDGCELKPSSREEVIRFNGIAETENASISCLNNSGFAFCRLAQSSGEPRYALVVLDGKNTRRILPLRRKSSSGDKP